MPSIYQILELPCSEAMWLATSAHDWKELSKASVKPSTLWVTIDELSTGCAYPANGLASLCLVVGILLRSYEIRKISDGYGDSNQHVRQALNYWQGSHCTRLSFNHATNFIVFPAAAYLYLSYELDTTQMMKFFLSLQFDELRLTLRRGKLVKGAQHACRALVPWATRRRNRTSMVYIPCGKLVFPVCAYNLLYSVLMQPRQQS